MKKKALDRVESIVREIIFSKNPLGLCSYGRGDELDREVRSIARQLDRIHFPLEASLVIANVFSSSLGPEAVATLDFQAYGRDLFHALAQAKPVGYRSGPDLVTKVVFVTIAESTRCHARGLGPHPHARPRHRPPRH